MNDGPSRLGCPGCGEKYTCKCNYLDQEYIPWDRFDEADRALDRELEARHEGEE